MKLKYLLTLVLFFSMVTPAYASIVTGSVTTGVSTGMNVNGLVIVAPTANPVGGDYTGTTQTVVLTKGVGATSIHYTTDGSVATCSSGTTYTTAITVNTDIVIEAVACYPNGVTSPELVAAYIINPPTPAPSSGGGGYTPPPAVAQADFNSDGNVSILDFNILITNWGTTTGATKATGDANGDGKVDIFDFNILITNWSV